MIVQLHTGDCLQVLRDIPSDSVDAVVTDPPYGMSEPADPVEVLKSWFAGVQYEHGSNGYLGSEWDAFVPGPLVWNEVLRVLKPGGHLLSFGSTRNFDFLGIAIRFSGFEVRDLIAWHYGSGMSLVKLQPNGWGPKLNPATEPIVVARKPLSEGSIAANIERWRTGALNIKGCLVEDDRRPKNMIHDGWSDPAGRFFYCAKPSKAERDEGLTGPEVTKHTFQTGNGASGMPSKMSEGRQTKYKNTHPTVKPTALMEYLCRLVTPKGGKILDPFMGSGSTGRGAVLGGFRFVGIDLSAEYVSIAEQRINAAINERLKQCRN